MPLEDSLHGPLTACSATTHCTGGPSSHWQALWSETPPLEVKGHSGRLYGGLAMGCLAPAHSLRRQAISLAESRPFDPIILLTILVNCAMMAWESPLDPKGTPKAALLDLCEWIVLGIFTFELAVKVVAYGVVTHPGAYLRDSWCQLDSVVVTLAWMPILLPSLGNYSALRALRALRPLRALKRVPGMPLLIRWIFEVLPKMGDVALLCAFLFLIFGIVGMELFKGSLHYRCARTGFEALGGHAPLDGGGARWNLSRAAASRRLGDGHGATAAGADPQLQWDTGIACDPRRSPSGCPAGTSCAYFEANPAHGHESFDTVPLTYIALMEAVTCAQVAPSPLVHRTCTPRLPPPLPPAIWRHPISAHPQPR